MTVGPEVEAIAARLVRSRRERGRASITIQEGTLSDYDALGRFHYLGGRPAVPASVLRAVSDVGTSSVLAGVLVVARPVLNARWRSAAWPGDYATADKRVDARRINAELRTIARVVVDPRCRGMGVASSLVRAYLQNPQTVRTEAIAAMGRWNPFFQAAGMRAIQTGDAPRDGALRGVLDAEGVPPWALALTGEALEDALGSSVVLRALKRWARGGSSSSKAMARGIEHAALMAARALVARPVAYAHG